MSNQPIKGFPEWESLFLGDKTNMLFVQLAVNRRVCCLKLLESMNDYSNKLGRECDCLILLICKR